MTDFRSHHDRSVALGPVTLVVGPNGAGKTNLLEAVWMVATTRSFRTSHDYQAIAWDASAAHITLDDWALTLASVPVPQKVCTIRGVSRRPIDYLGSLRAVVFTPDSFALFSTPAARRQFLDTVLAQRDQTIARDLLRYRQIVRQRNSLLRAIALGRGSTAELAVWDEQLATAAVALRRVREQFVTEFTPLVRQAFALLGSDSPGDLVLTYQSTGPASSAEFLAQLAAERPRELALGATAFGPHRDDLAMRFGNRLASDHASRGQLRRILLAIKAAEVRVLAASDAPVILLLDDVASELDEEHRAALGYLTRDTQTMITTTDLDRLPAAVREAASVVTLSVSAE